MPFLLLLVLTPACLQEVWTDPEFGVGTPERGAMLTGASVVFFLGLSLVLSALTRRRLWLSPGSRDKVLARYGAFRTYYQLALFALHAMAVYVFGWGWFVQTILAPTPETPLPPGGELLVLAPFLVTLFGSWVFFYDAERTIYLTGRHAPETPFWTRAQYLLFQTRNNLALVSLPVLMVIGLKALRWVIPGGLDAWGWGGTALTVLAVLACYALMPLVLRVILGLRPLPQGLLRERLMAASRRLNFRCSDILLWNTRGGIANALVVGLTPWLRYVVFTDRLLTEMTMDEVEAVFGHEVGHIKHWHMPFYLVFLKASMMAAWAGLFLLFALIGRFVPEPQQQLLEHILPQGEAWEWLTIGVLGAYIFAVFGFISRRCERQADVYGCRAVSCDRPDCQGHESPEELTPNGRGLCPTGIHTFVSALEKVAYLNGISRRKPGFLQSWQHGSIARRVDFLLRMHADPGLEPQFQRQFGLLKGSILLGLLGVFAVCLGLGWWLAEGLGPRPDAGPETARQSVIGTEETQD